MYWLQQPTGLTRRSTPCPVISGSERPIWLRTSIYCRYRASRTLAFSSRTTCQTMSRARLGATQAPLKGQTGAFASLSLSLHEVLPGERRIWEGPSAARHHARCLSCRVTVGQANNTVRPCTRTLMAARIQREDLR